MQEMKPYQLAVELMLKFSHWTSIVAVLVLSWMVNSLNWFLKFFFLSSYKNFKSNPLLSPSVEQNIQRSQGVTAYRFVERQQKNVYR